MFPLTSGHIDLLEVNISLLNGCFDQLHAQPVTNIDTVKSPHQFTFNRYTEKPDPGTLLGDACDDRIELLSDSSQGYLSEMDHSFRS
jgi:hypothetical protein